MGFHVRRHVGEALAQAPHLGGKDYQHDQGRHADHHDEALDEVGLQGGHVAPQHHHQGEAMAMMTMHTRSSMPKITEHTLVRPLYTEAE